jgi:DNA-binding response OmpR family regulator
MSKVEQPRPPASMDRPQQDRGPAILLFAENSERSASIRRHIERAGLTCRTATTVSPPIVGYGRRCAAAIVIAVLESPGQLIASVRSCGLTSPILALCERAAAMRADLLAAGADQCAPLTIGCDELGQTLHSLLKTKAASRSRLPSSIWLDSVSHDVGVGEKTTRLSAHEFAMLCCLLESTGRPVSAEQLRGFVWGGVAAGYSDKHAVTVYLHRLRRKLASIGLATAVVTRRNLGYEFRPLCDSPSTDPASNALANDESGYAKP